MFMWEKLLFWCSRLAACVLLYSMAWGGLTQFQARRSSPAMQIQTASTLPMISRVPTWLRIALGLNALGLGVWLPRRLRQRTGKAAGKSTPVPQLYASRGRQAADPAPIDLKSWLQDGRLPPAIHETTPDGKPTPDAEFLDHLHGLIKDRNITVAGLSAALHRSERQLQRRIRRLFGITPRQLLIQARLQRSLQLLESGQSVKATALMLGFASQENFTRFFRIQMSMSPTDYRHQKKNTDSAITARSEGSAGENVHIVVVNTRRNVNFE